MRVEERIPERFDSWKEKATRGWIVLLEQMVCEILLSLGILLYSAFGAQSKQR